jgi:hypothetical protein
MDHCPQSIVNSPTQTKTPDGEAEGFFAVGVRAVLYQIVCILSKKCYNVATMRYERSDNIFLCIGVRGFDGEGLSIHAPVARR